MTLTTGGWSRDYLVYVPTSYTGERRVPVLFNFHGFGSNAVEQMIYGNFRPLADSRGFIIVAPDGQGQGGSKHFNILGTPGEADDVAFTLTVLEQLEDRFCLDSRRVYSTGMSDGGAMTSLLACKASNRFAAFGPVAVVFYAPECSSSRSVPIATFMGTADPVVPFNGGRVHCCGHPSIPGAPASMQAWATHDRCKATPVDHQLSPMVVLRQWTGCASGSEVRFYMIQGGGHTWPGSPIDVTSLGLTTHEVSASNTVWAFFESHPLTK